MEKCLVTKLRGYVYNDTLPLFKELLMPVVSGTAYVNCVEATTIRAIGDLTINGQKETSVKQGWNTLTLVGEGIMGIQNLKYSIAEINAPLDLSKGIADSWFGMDVTRFITDNYLNKADINNNVYDLKDIVKYFPNLTELRIGGTGVHGEIDSILDLLKLESIGSVSATSVGISKMDITGIFDKLGYLTKVSNFGNFVASCTLDGTIENFVYIRRVSTANAAGRVEFNYINNYSTIYYQGALLPNKRLTIVEWDASGKITLTQQD